ncbi:structural polyprotein isoform X1 [Tasmannia lanceolata]|uniref:structural polyprotein isoform X1 n=1 Tax=Tasmannia lanceolata TaxID=3420 RepID=UPI004063AC39
MRNLRRVSLPFLLITLFSSSTFPWSTHAHTQTQTLRGKDVEERGSQRRSMLSFRETKGNASFECSLAGPCVACHYSEKNEEKYRCSETGYRIPLKCVETEDGSKEANNKKFQKRRSALDDDSTPYKQPKVHASLKVAKQLNTQTRRDAVLTPEGGKQSYITYRSCVPPEDEEKLSVLGFEGIVLCLLFVSAPVVYFRRKRAVTVSGIGAVRIPTNSRF